MGFRIMRHQAVGQGMTAELFIKRVLTLNWFWIVPWNLITIALKGLLNVYLRYLQRCRNWIFSFLFNTLWKTGLRFSNIIKLLRHSKMKPILILLSWVMLTYLRMSRSSWSDMLFHSSWSNHFNLFWTFLMFL